MWQPTNALETLLEENLLMVGNFLVLVFTYRINHDLIVLNYYSKLISLDMSLLKYHSWHVSLFYSLWICHSQLVTLDVTINVTLNISLLTCHSWPVTGPYMTIWDIGKSFMGHSWEILQFQTFLLLTHSLTLARPRGAFAPKKFTF